MLIGVHFESIFANVCVHVYFIYSTRSSVESVGVSEEWQIGCHIIKPTIQRQLFII